MSKKYDFTIAVLADVLPASLAITLDVLQAANLLAAYQNKPALTWRLVAQHEVTSLAHGLCIQTKPWSSRLLSREMCLIIPGINVFAANKPPITFAPDQMHSRLQCEDAQQLIKILRQHASQQGCIAASCAAVFLLAEAGLLHRRQATTHWRLAQDLRDRYPDCIVDAKRILISDGSILTAGAAMAQMDLMLYLVRQKLGQEIADLTLRYLLLDEHGSQSSYIVRSHVPYRDPLLVRLEGLVSQSLPNVPSIEELAQTLHTTSRTLHRKVRAATQESTEFLIRQQRFFRAKELLENTRLSQLSIAGEIGYADASALCKLTKAFAGQSPQQMRISMRGALLQAADV